MCGGGRWACLQGRSRWGARCLRGAGLASAANRLHWGHYPRLRRPLRPGPRRCKVRDRDGDRDRDRDRVQDRGRVRARGRMGWKRSGQLFSRRLLGGAVAVGGGPGAAAEGGFHQGGCLQSARPPRRAPCRRCDHG